MTSKYRYRAGADVLFSSPPQTFVKVLTMAIRGGGWSLPKATLWEVMNDLLVDGVDMHVLDSSIDEMRDMFLISVQVDSSNKESISLMNPALGDIAYDVCTPEQIESISLALLARLDSLQNSDFQVPLQMAKLHHRLGHPNPTVVKWIEKGCRMLLDMRKEMTESEIAEAGIDVILETIDEEIKSCGHDVREIIPDLSYPIYTNASIEMDLLFLGFYIPPISMGPMGHTLGSVTRSIFYETKMFSWAPSVAERNRLKQDLASASQRYCKEVQIVESFLAEYGLDAEPKSVFEEIELVIDLAQPSATKADVRSKSKRVHQELIPNFIEPRRKRLLQLVKKVQNEKLKPPIFSNAEPGFWRAFEALVSGRRDVDAAHDALMILAINHWKPKRIPETLPMLHYQTLARIRNKILRRTTDAELAIFKHRQGPLDLGAFLIITPLLYEAGEKDSWYS